MMQAQNPRDSGIRCAATTMASRRWFRKSHPSDLRSLRPDSANRARWQRGG